MIEFQFFGMPIKTLGSLAKIRVGRVTGNTHIFFLALPVLSAHFFLTVVALLESAEEKEWQFNCFHN